MLVDQTNNNERRWNPFITTKRDIAQTEYLASKNATLAGVLSFLFVPAGLIYLNRGINALKILGYVFAASFVLGLGSQSEEDATDLGGLVGLIGTGAITYEQVMAVNKARQRQQEKNTLISASNFDESNKNHTGIATDTTAVKLLKQLKEKYQANEISEEEFKLQKQEILESM